MKSRIYAIILAFAMLLTLLPTGNYSAAQAGLMFRWCSQDANANFDVDEHNNYLPDMEDPGSYYLETYENTNDIKYGSPVFFYYVDFNGQETAVSLNDLKSSNENIITLEDDHGSVMIKVEDTAKVGDVAYVNYMDGNHNLIDRMRVEIVELGNGTPGANTPRLAFRWPDWGQNGPSEDLNQMLQDEFVDSPGFDRTLFFYYVDNNGETRIHPNEIHSSNENIVRVSQSTENGDAARVDVVGFGKTTLYYENNGQKYTMEVDISLAHMGFYTSKAAHESTYIREFTVTNNQNEFYLVARDGWTIDSVNLQDGLADIATYTIDASGEFATIQVNGPISGNNNGWYQIEYVISNARFGQSGMHNSNGIRLIDGKPGLKWCSPYWDPNTQSHSKPQNPQWNSTLDMSPFGGNFYISYMENGVETPLQATDLESSNENILRVNVSSDNPDMVWLEPVGFGDVNIIYTHPTSRERYVLSTKVSLPTLGFYNDKVASGSSYVTEFTVTETEDTVYFIARDGWRFDNISLEPQFDDVADLTLSADRTVATIKITGNPMNDSWYQVNYYASHPQMNGVMNDHLSIKLYNEKSRGQFVSEVGMGGLDYSDCVYTAPGMSMEYWVVFMDATGGEPYVIELETLKSSNEDVFIIEPVNDPDNPDKFKLTVVGWGDAKLIFKDANGKEYSLPVSSRLNYQGFGFYSENHISEQSWIPYAYTVKNYAKTFYFKAQNGWTFDNFRLMGAAADFATISLTPDKQTLTITVTDKIKDYASAYGDEVDLYFEFDSWDQWGGQYGNSYCLRLKNGLCSHPQTSVVGAKKESCTIAGHTGDVVCGQCNDIVTKGTVIKATGHTSTKVVNQKAATCTTAGYTGDTVCNICQSTVTKGKVVAATGHSYKDGKCATCGEKDPTPVVVQKISIKNAKVTLSATAYNYDGKAKKPKVTVKVGKTTLKEGTDYTVKYSKNKNIGTAKVTITSKGNYEGSVSKTFTIKAKKGKTFESGNYTYKVTGSDTVEFTGIVKSKVSKTKKVTVANTVTYGGKKFKVTSIADKALKGKNKITQVTIGTNVTKIGKSAFEGCKKLKTITIKTTKLKSVGKRALKGINAKATIKIPSKYVDSYKKVLKGKGQGSKVKIKK